MAFAAGIKKQLYHRKTLIYLSQGWLESSVHVERCGSGTWTGAGGISAVGMDSCDAGEQDFSHKTGKQTTALAEGEKGIQNVSFQTEINLKK